MNLATQCRFVRDFLYFKFKDSILLEAYMCMLVCSRIVDVEVDAIECFKLEIIVPYARNGICLHPRQGEFDTGIPRRAISTSHDTLVVQGRKHGSFFKNEEMQ